MEIRNSPIAPDLRTPGLKTAAIGAETLLLAFKTPVKKNCVGNGILATLVQEMGLLNLKLWEDAAVNISCEWGVGEGELGNEAGASAQGTIPAGQKSRWTRDREVPVGSQMPVAWEWTVEVNCHVDPSPAIRGSHSTPGSFCTVNFWRNAYSPPSINVTPISVNPL